MIKIIKINEKHIQVGTHYFFYNFYTIFSLEYLLPLATSNTGCWSGNDRVKFSKYSSPFWYNWLSTLHEKLLHKRGSVITKLEKLMRRDSGQFVDLVLLLQIKQKRLFGRMGVRLPYAIAAPHWISHSSHLRISVSLTCIHSSYSTD